MSCSTEGACDIRVASVRAGIFGSVRAAVAMAAVVTAAIGSVACAGRPREHSASQTTHGAVHLPRAPPGQPVPDRRTRGRR